MVYNWPCLNGSENKANTRGCGKRSVSNRSGWGRGLTGMGERTGAEEAEYVIYMEYRQGC